MIYIGKRQEGINYSERKHDKTIKREALEETRHIISQSSTIIYSIFCNYVIPL